jgi:hypothetical protein
MGKTLNERGTRNNNSVTHIISKDYAILALVRRSEPNV